MKTHKKTSLVLVFRAFVVRLLGATGRAFMVSGALTVLAATAKADTVFWTVRPDGGVLVNSTGLVALNLGNYQPTSPSPAGSTWTQCLNNWVYFHKTIDGTPLDDKHVNRMLAVAVSAFKTGSKIRIALERDESSGACYTKQIFDQGP